MENKIMFEAPKCPEIEESFKVQPDTQEFNEPEKAKAIIINLGLSVGDTLRENGDSYVINPKMVLNGNSPEKYQEAIDNLKKILTPSEVGEVTKAMKRRTKDYDEKLYDRIKKRFDKFFKNFEPKKNLKKDLQEFLNYDKALDMGGIYNIIYHLLSKDKSDFIGCYKCAWKNKPVPNIQIWSEEDEGEYRVLTDSEADSACDDYLDDDYLWKESVSSGNTTLGFEDWKQWVVDMDGRGNCLNSYDGCEESQEVNGTDYYIYRTN